MWLHTVLFLRLLTDVLIIIPKGPGQLQTSQVQSSTDYNSLLLQPGGKKS